MKFFLADINIHNCTLNAKESWLGFCAMPLERHGSLSQELNFTSTTMDASDRSTRGATFVRCAENDLCNVSRSASYTMSDKRKQQYQ